MDKRLKAAFLFIAVAAFYAYSLKRAKRVSPRLVINNGYTQPTKVVPQPPQPPRPPIGDLKVIPFHWFLDMPRTNVSDNDTPLDLIEGA